MNFFDRFLWTKAGLAGGGAFGIVLYSLNLFLFFNAKLFGMVLILLGFVASFVNVRAILPFIMLSCLFLDIPKIEQKWWLFLSICMLYSIINIIAMYGTMITWVN